jgi:hypothetical protein
MNSEDGICPSKSCPSVQVSHVHLSSAPQMILGSLPPWFLELLSLWGHILVGVYTLFLSGHLLCPFWPIISHMPPPCWPGFPPQHAQALHTQFLSHTPWFSAHHTITTSPLLFPGPEHIQPFSSLTGYPGPISYWFAWLCGRPNRNWQVVLALLLVHSVLWAGQWKLTVVLQFPLSSYINWNCCNLIALQATCSC